MSERYARALYEFSPEGPAELALQPDQVLRVFSWEGDWWEGENEEGEQGIFPGNHVEFISLDEPQQIDLVIGGELDTGGQTQEYEHEYENKQMYRGDASSDMSLGTKQLESRDTIEPLKGKRISNDLAPKVTRDNPQYRRKSIGGGVLQPYTMPDVYTSKYGIWASEMVILSTPIIAVLGACSMIWGSIDDGRGLAYVIIGFYAILFSVFSLVYEFNWGKSRSGESFPWRAILYFIFSFPFYFTVPTVFGGTWIFCVVMANLAAAYKREDYEPTKEVKNSKSRKPNHVYNSILDKFMGWITLKKQSNLIGTVIFLFGYAVANVIVWFWALGVWVDRVNDMPDGKRLSGWVPLAKAFGNCLDFNCSLVVVPVLRTIIRWFYNTSTADETCCAKTVRGCLSFIPLDKAVDFHKVVAWVIGFHAIGHTLMHLFNFMARTTLTWDMFGIDPWLSGGIIFFCMILMYSSALNSVKIGHYEAFWYTHHLFIIFFTVLLLHGRGSWNPNFWKWFLFPGLLYLIERLLRFRRARKKAVLLGVSYMTPDDSVYCLEFAKKGVFKEPYKEGQYVFICCPYLSNYQWHAFTISSAPQEKTVTIHIKRMKEGSWTDNLAKYLRGMGPMDASYVKLVRQTDDGVKPGKYVGPDGSQLLQIDGPHSAPTQHQSEFETVLVCGGGIGITPMASAVKSITLFKWRMAVDKVYPENAYFCWICSHKDVDYFRWLIRMIKVCEDQIFHMRETQPQDMAKKRIEFHIYITSVGKSGKEPIRREEEEIKDEGFWGIPQLDPSIDLAVAPFSTYQLYNAMCNPEKHTRIGDVHIYKGRPDWEFLFERIDKAHPKGNVGVLYCGNTQIAKDLEKMCTKYSNPGSSFDGNENDNINLGRSFNLHKENF